MSIRSLGAKIRNALLQKSNAPLPPLDLYNLEGTVNIHSSSAYRDSRYFARFEPTYEDFKNNLELLVDSNTSTNFYKYGDGDYYFLKGEENGSARPGKRALSKSYSEIDLPRFQEESRKMDHYLCEIPDDDRIRFAETFPDKIISFPAEYSYGVVASRWIFKNFAKDIGIIGADKKIDLIEQLLKYPEYRNYLGLGNETPDLIRIPQKFACDDLDSTIDKVSKQIIGSRKKIFILGVGHVKSGLLTALVNIHPAVYLDVGSGIDALAGVIDIRRPYFGGWTNFKLPNSDKYIEIDYLQVDNPGKIFYLKEVTE